MSKQQTATVVQEFVCKLSNQFYRSGSQYTGDEERINFLIKEGYVEVATEVAASFDSDVQQGEEVIDSVTPVKRKNGTKDKPE